MLAGGVIGSGAQVKESGPQQRFRTTGPLLGLERPPALVRALLVLELEQAKLNKRRVEIEYEILVEEDEEEPSAVVERARIALAQRHREHSLLGLQLHVEQCEYDLLRHDAREARQPADAGSIRVLTPDEAAALSRGEPLREPLEARMRSGAVRAADILADERDA